MSSESPVLHFALVLFPQWEPLDVAGPVEVLHFLPRIPTFPYGDKLKFSIIAESLDPVTTGPPKDDPSPLNRAIEYRVVPTHTFDNPPKDIDVLIVPGGLGAGPAFKPDYAPDVSKPVAFIREQYPKLKHLLSQ
jgi:putative intracellular protease/amidase